ncbi:MAG: prephenate dehydratase [Nanoarchaeota archaeon]
MKISILGPAGTFSHEAALKYNKNATIIFKNTIRDVFESVSTNEAEFGLVPVENSIAGTIGQTLDYLIRYKLNIVAEETLSICHNLVGFGKTKGIRVLYLHQQTYEQCESFVKKILPKTEIIFTSSNGKSAEILAKSKKISEASILPNIATRIYKLKIIKKDVQDNAYNVTRFFIIGKNDNGKTNHDKTSIALRPKADRPGLLFKILGEFAKRSINLTKIESRPTKGKLGEYIFYVDFEGHSSEDTIKTALKEIESSALVIVLGSYPRRY